MKIQQLLEDRHRRQYDDFEKWKKDAKDNGYKVRKTTVTNFNTYYQAIGDGLVGFFNTAEGKKGKDPVKTGRGEMTVQIKGIGLGKSKLH